MSTIVLTARMVTAGGEAREELLNHLEAAAKYAQTNEPGVYRYLICLPRDEADGKTVWAIEEYADAEALEGHFASEPVRKLIESVRSNPSLQEDHPVVRQLAWLGDAPFSGKGLEIDDPVIVFGHLEFEEGEREQGFEALRLKAERRGDVYGSLVEEELDDDVFTLEIGSHLESGSTVRDALEVDEKMKGMLERVSFATLKLRAGYAGRM